MGPVKEGDGEGEGKKKSADASVWERLSYREQRQTRDKPLCYHYATRDLEEIGGSLCKSLLEWRLLGAGERAELKRDLLGIKEENEEEDEEGGKATPSRGQAGGEGSATAAGAAGAVEAGGGAGESETDSGSDSDPEEGCLTANELEERWSDLLEVREAWVPKEVEPQAGVREAEGGHGKEQEKRKRSTSFKGRTRGVGSAAAKAGSRALSALMRGKPGRLDRKKAGIGGREPNVMYASR